MADEGGRKFGLGHVFVAVDDCSEKHSFIEAEKGNHNAVLDQDALPGNSEPTGAGADPETDKQGCEPHGVGPGNPFETLVEPVATLGGRLPLFLDCRGIQEQGQDVVDSDRRAGRPVGAVVQGRGNIPVEGVLKAAVFCFADKKEKEESFEEAYKEEVEGETEDAAVPALTGRVGDARGLLFGRRSR